MERGRGPFIWRVAATDGMLRRGNFETTTSTLTVDPHLIDQAAMLFDGNVTGMDIRGVMAWDCGKKAGRRETTWRIIG